MNDMFTFAMENIATAVMTTVVPTKSDSDVMFCLQSYQEL